MSELFDDDPRATPPPRQAAPRRSRALLITAVVVIVAIFGLTGFSSIYTDRLWYQSIGFGGVFSTLLWTRIGLFLVFGAVLGGVVALNIYLAYRFRPLFRPNSREQTNLDRYRDVVTPIRVWVVVGVALLVGAFAGASGMSNWRTYLLWRNGTAFGQDDPYFSRDIGFYVFDLPWVHFVVDFSMATFVIAIIGALATHYLYGGLRLQSGGDRLSPAAQAQLSVLLGLFVLAKGVDYYLDRFDLVNQDNSLFTGMNYTAENAVLPAKNILIGVALICSILFFLNVWRRTWQLPTMGLGLLVLSAILLGMIWPAIVQQFQVNPSEADKEEPYIGRNIDATQAAYDLQDVETTPYSPNTSLDATPAELAPLLSSVPLVDPKQVSPAFENIQQERGYYSVADVLDVDRYELNGSDRAVVLGVRELDQDGLSPDARNWSNLHTVFTHGNGIIAAYANQRDGDNTVTSDTSAGSTSSGGLEWAQGINSSEVDISSELGDFESRIYYGEKSPDYSVVGKESEDAEGIELNLPIPGSDIGATTTFDGPGDASVGSTFNQLMFAIKFGEPNFLLSGRVNGNSEVLFDRDPTSRVEKVAPWLTVDSDVYPAVVDGRIQWIVDGYTTTDRYPLAQRESFETMITDALQVQTGIQTLPTDEINYMRNAVKATVDAYTGAVTLYAWDEQDPLLKAWMGAFPGTVQPKSDMSADLMAHVRYPEDLFKVQRYQFARYHVSDASDWYEFNDRWSVAQDPQATSAVFQAPYRLFVGGADASNFSLTSVYVPYERENLASFVSVNSDADSDDYGKIKVLRLNDAEAADDDQTSGPGQVANVFISDQRINEALLPLKNSGARVTYGNMLTFPINNGLMYTQPVYVSRQVTDASYPELRFVQVKFGDDIGYGTTFQNAIQDLFGSGTTTPPVDPNSEDPQVDPPVNNNNGGPDDPATGNLQQQLDRALSQALAAFDRADTALSGGDLGTYQEEVARAQTLLGQVVSLKDRIDNRGGGADATAASDTP